MRNTVPILSTENQNPTPHSLALSFKFGETHNSSLWLLLIITLLLLYSCQSKPLIMRFPHESNMLIRCECQHRCTTLEHQTFFKCSGILFCVDHPSMIGTQWMDGHDHEADTTRLRIQTSFVLLQPLLSKYRHPPRRLGEEQRELSIFKFPFWFLLLFFSPLPRSRVSYFFFRSHIFRCSYGFFPCFCFLVFSSRFLGQKLFPFQSPQIFESPAWSYCLC